MCLKYFLLKGSLNSHHFLALVDIDPNYKKLIMKKSIFLSLVLSLSIVFAYPNGVQSERLPLPFVILPQPQNVILLNGSGLEPGILKTVILKGQFSRPVMGNLLSHLTTGDPATKGTLTLILDKSLSSPASDEGYIMTVTVTEWR